MAGNTADKKVSVPKLNAMQVGATLSESFSIRGKGGIFFRREPSEKIQAYYKYQADGKTRQEKIGVFAPSNGGKGLTLAQIRTRAEELAALKLQHGDVKSFLIEQEQSQAEEKARREREATLEARKGTFQDMLDGYVRGMYARGRTKASEVERLFKKHISIPNPEIVALPAHKVTRSDLSIVFRKILACVPAGRGRGNKTPAAVTSMESTCNTVLTYVRAAYVYALTTTVRKGDNAAETKEFQITENIARYIKADAIAPAGTTRSLTEYEFGALLRYLDTLPARKSAICKSVIYLGGQRLSQLLSVPWSKVEPEYLVLLDSKGKKASPWEHLVPITPRIKEILSPLLSDRIGKDGPFSMGRTSRHVNKHTEEITITDTVQEGSVSTWFGEAGIALMADENVQRFSFINVRATVESLLTHIGISKEIRAWLLSHGRPDVQDKHYQRNTFLHEKTEALKLWGEYLDTIRDGKTWKDGRAAQVSKRYVATE